MEFWGVEVKAGETAKVEVGGETVVHISMAALGELKNDKGNELIPLFLNANGQKFVIGTLSTGKICQIAYDLVLEKNFELSHNWKNGSVYFSGYKSFLEDLDDDNTDSDSGSDFGNELPVPAKENGEPEPRDEKLKAAKSKGKIAEASKIGISKGDDSDDSEDDSEESGPEGGPMDVPGEDSSEDDDDDDDGDDSSDEGDDSSDEDEETPKKAEQGKKRPAESASKTPVAEKRAKIVTPQKTGDSKKGPVHVATPYPVKRSGKAPTNEKSKQQTPKSASQVVCKSCSKPFNSESALQSHTKAKHTGGK